MEIGNKSELSAYEITYYTRKAIGLTIISILLTVFLSYILIANYTSLVERKIFRRIANEQGYELSYSNVYEVLSSDNSVEGNYIQLADRENNIYILFRYDEDTEIFKAIDENTNKSSFYAIYSNDETNKIRDENSLIKNIDKEFNQLSMTSVKGNMINYGGGYSITLMDSVYKQHRVCFTSNLLDTNNDINIESDKDIKELHSVKQLFSYDNSINYKLGIMKALVETNNTDTGSSNHIKYSGETNNYDEDTDDNKEYEKSLDGFTATRKKENINSKMYSTYNCVILNPDNKMINQLFNKDGRDSGYNRGVIIGICDNSSEAIGKMETTLKLLTKISLLEKTMIL